MLTLTRDAEHAIEMIVEQAGPPEIAGVRISTEHSRDNGGIPARDVRLSVIDSPEAGDETVEGSPVYLEPDAAQLLDDKVLDAEFSAGRIHFNLRNQDE